MSGFAGAWMMTKLWRPAAVNSQQIGPVLIISRGEPASKKMEEEQDKRSEGDQKNKGAIQEAKGKKESRSHVLSEAAVCMLMDRFAPS